MEVQTMYLNASTECVTTRIQGYGVLVVFLAAPYSRCQYVRSNGFLAVETCSKGILTFTRGMEKVHAFWDLIFEGC